jgi:cyclopropane-fatty-acyl-phospholipid synthase
MTTESRSTTGASLGTPMPNLKEGFAQALLTGLLGSITSGALVVSLPSGSQFTLQGHRPGPHAQLDIQSWRFFRRLVSAWRVGFGEAYMAGEWSSPDLVALLSFACMNCIGSKTLPPLFLPQIALKLHHARNRSTRRASKRNIAAHYDLGNAFYALWLDAGMTYSSALYTDPSSSLEEAQLAKIDRALALADLEGGERVLEIGCGWGGLAERLLQKQDCTVTGVTLSAEQLAYAKRRLASEVETGRCSLLYCDYRDIEGTFDVIFSIEMMEAVGESYWATYFEKLRERVRPGGTIVLQVITIDESRFEDYRRRPDFIQRYIFPGGMLPTISIIACEAERAGLRLMSSEFFGDSYARTLEAWRYCFKNAWPQIKELGFDDRFGRMWDYYLAYCQAGFACKALEVGLYKLKRATVPNQP